MASADPTPTAAATDTDRLAHDAERIFEELHERIQRLADLSRRRMESMRAADTAALAAVIAGENEAVQEVAEIEKRRIAVVGRLAERLGSPDKTQTRLSWVAQRLGGAAGERLARRADELRAAMASLRAANEAAREAAQHLAAHMEGLWRQTAAALNHAGTYGRAGAVAPGPRVVSSLDLRS